jgi:hypothetical protein
VPAAYRGMSAWIAQEIAREVHAEINTTDVVVIESARGAGPDGGRDRYGEELFQPFITELGSDVTFANVEMVVRDMETVIQRMDERLLTETNAAPSFVTLKYISEVEGVQSSFHQAQHEGAFDLNSVVDNSGDIDDTMILVEGLTAQVMALLARGEGILPEGQRRRKED